MKDTTFEKFSHQFALAPSRPDIEYIIVIPHKTVYRNVAANVSANTVRLIFNSSEPVGFEFYRLERL